MTGYHDEEINPENFIISGHFDINEQLKFHAQLI